MLVCAVAAVFLASSGWIAWHRGIWYDEVWSLYFAHHDAGFGRAMAERWLKDNHPPLFYALDWLVEPFVGDDLFAKRMLNVIPLCLAAAGLGWLARRDARARPFVLVEALLILATPHAFDAMIDHRSYMIQLASGTVIAAGLFAVFIGERDYEPADRPLVWLIGAALLIGFNTHYFFAAITGFLVAIFIVSLWLRGRRRWAVRLLAAACVAGIPLVATYLLQRSVLEGTAQVFWADTSLASGFRQIKLVAKSPWPINLIVAGAALWAVGRRLRKRDVEALPNGAIAYAATAAIAILAVTPILLGINAVRPFIVPRYLIALVPFASGLLAALAGRVVYDRFWLGCLVALGALAGIHAAFALQEPVRQWDATGRIVADAVRNCPSAIVHARPRWMIRGDQPPQQVMANEPAIVRFGYAYEAQRWGFHLADETSTRIARRCPTLIWIEQHKPASAADIAIWSGLAFTPEQIQHAKILTGETGFVVAYPAAVSNIAR